MMSKHLEYGFLQENCHDIHIHFCCEYLSNNHLQDMITKLKKSILQKVLNSSVNFKYYPLCKCKNVESCSSLRVLI